MIFAECYNDQALMHRLGIIPDNIRHEFGRSRVLFGVENWERSVIGVIDEDPKSGKHPLIKNYELVKGSVGRINLMERKGEVNKWLIIVPFFLEDWLCKLAKRSRIRLDDYNLSDNPMELHKISFMKNDNARRFLIDLVKAEDNELLEFKKWLDLVARY